MTRRAGWAGPYCHAEDAAGNRLPWNPLDARPREKVGPPTGAARLVVRWRAPGLPHPRKQTFPARAHIGAAELARRIAAAALTGAPADEHGRPHPVAPADPPPAGLWVARPTTGVGSATDDTAAAPAEAGGASEDQPRPRPRTDTAMTTTAIAPQPGPTPDGDPAALGPTVADYIAELVAVHAPRWLDGGQHAWWIGQLEIVAACYTYAAGDPRLGTYGLLAGTSKHLRLLEQADFSEALRIRRATNLAARHRNAQRRASHAAALERWQAAQARAGGGRRPAKPVEPDYEPDYVPDPATPLISARTEQAFGMVQSFVFDRAHDGGLFAAGNPWRRYQPRGNGGRGAKSSHYRAPMTSPPTERSFPGAGFFVDLGDTLARLGAAQPDGRRTGERYRVLPLAAWQCAPRPGELRTLRVDELPARHRGAEHRLQIHALKRDVGTLRHVDLADLVGQLLGWHVDAGLGSSDGLLFASPAGCMWDPSNWTEDFLWPALTGLCQPGGLWDDFGGLRTQTAKLFRKAGVSGWLGYGLDPSQAAAWAGHDETVQVRHYKGMVAAARRHGRHWTGMDDYVRQSLADDPPRGDGDLATWIRAWLASQP